jgi:hypothetical protein
MYKKYYEQIRHSQYEYRKGYMAPGCNLYTSMIRAADAIDSRYNSKRESIP